VAMPMSMPMPASLRVVGCSTNWQVCARRTREASRQGGREQSCVSPHVISALCRCSLGSRRVCRRLGLSSSSGSGTDMEAWPDPPPLVGDWQIGRVTPHANSAVAARGALLNRAILREPSTSTSLVNPNIVHQSHMLINAWKSCLDSLPLGSRLHVNGFHLRRPG
jgi:hypothetical protein